MVIVTKVLRPGAPRIGHLTEHFVLPRTVPLIPLLAAVAGGLVGLLFGLMAGLIIGSMNFVVIVLSMVVFGALGVGLTQWKTGTGESMSRAFVLSAKARRQSKKLTCPGSGELPNWDPDLGSSICAVCRVVVQTEDELAKVHDWRRQFYVGMMPVSQPTSGAIKYTPGSRPVDRRYLEK